MDYHYDYLVIGSGIAGLTFALNAAGSGKVAVLTKRRVFDSNTDYAQGGMAGVFGKGDSKALHVSDTLEAGAGLCNPAAVRALVQNAPAGIRWLQKKGVKFERGKDGLALAREGGHSRNRVTYAGDVTGREVEGALVKEARSHPRIEVYENNLAIDLIVNGGECVGAQFLNLGRNRVDNYYAKATVLATGGLGAMYLETTNPEVATGDGIAMAYRAGAVLQDMEFVQFHPTKLDLPMEQPFLITEALRGEGGVLRNSRGEAFMSKYDARRELATRDIVSRAIYSEMRKGKVFLDVTGLGRKFLRERFYNIYRTCLREGLEIGRTWIPVTPAAHYSCGGVKTDLKGRTGIKRLFAIGEVACTGVHGANRLASNSLSEGLVWGIEAAKEAAKLPRLGATGMHPLEPRVVSETGREKLLRTQIKAVMWENAGIVRKNSGLSSAIKELAAIKARADVILRRGASYEAVEAANMALVGLLVAKAASARKESRGCHFNTDWPGKAKTARHGKISRARSVTA
ncbi:MAG: L-aspartate oxidase [Candidatus Micrarchaeota archaeon]